MPCPIYHAIHYNHPTHNTTMHTQTRTFTHPACSQAEKEKSTSSSICTFFCVFDHKFPVYLRSFFKSNLNRKEKGIYLCWELRRAGLDLIHLCENKRDDSGSELGPAIQYQCILSGQRMFCLSISIFYVLYLPTRRTFLRWMNEMPILLIDDFCTWCMHQISFLFCSHPWYMDDTERSSYAVGNLTCHILPGGHAREYIYHANVSLLNWTDLVYVSLVSGLFRLVVSIRIQYAHCQLTDYEWKEYLSWFFLTSCFHTLIPPNISSTYTASSSF